MHFLTEQSIAYGGLFGEVALLGTFAALAPERSWALLDAVQSGRHDEAAGSDRGSRRSTRRSSPR
jgi:hypothetical protein